MIALNILILAALKLPSFQGQVGSLVAHELSSLLQTNVSIGRIELGLFNQVVIEDVNVDDRKDKPMLHADKLVVNMDVFSLLEGKIRIHTAQIFTLRANLYREKANLPDNFQFVIDALSSKEKKEPSKLDLQLHLFILRDASLSYNKLYLPRRSTFDAAHLNVSHLNVQLSLDELTNKHLKAHIQELSLTEKCGLVLKNLKADLEADSRQAMLQHFRIRLPHSALEIDSLVAHYPTDRKVTLDNLDIYAKSVSSSLVLADLQAFVPQLSSFKESLDIDFSLDKQGKKIALLPFNIHTSLQDLRLGSSVYLTLPEEGQKNPTIHATVRRLSIQPRGFSMLFRSLQLGDVPALLTRLGELRYEGHVSTDLSGGTVDGLLSSTLGQLRTSIQLDQNHVVKGELQSEQLELGKLLPASKLGSTAFRLAVDGSLENKQPTGKLNGEIHYLDYNSYRYQNIQVDARYAPQELSGRLAVSDENCRFTFAGNVLGLNTRPSYSLTLQAEKVNPFLLGLLKKEGVYSGELAVNATGSTIDDLVGQATLSNFQVADRDSTYAMDKLTVVADRQDGQRSLEIASSFLNAQIEGNFTYTTLPQSIMKTLQKCLPSVFSTGKETHPDNQFTLHASLADATPLNHFLGIPLTVKEEILVDQRITDKLDQLQLTVDAGSFDYNGEHYESGQLHFNGNQDLLSLTAEVNRINKGHPLSLALKAIAQFDDLHTDISWNNNNTREVFSGKLSSVTRFQKELNGPVNVNVSVLPSEAIINDTAWQIRPSNIDYQHQKIKITNLALENGSKHLKVNGTVGNEETDTLRADLKEINLEYVFDALNFHPVDFAGIATGKAMATGLLKEIDFDARLFVRDFQFQHGLLGNMNLEGKWDKASEGIYFNGYISEFASASNDSTAVWKAFRKETDAAALTRVQGTVSPKHTRLNLNVEANRTNLHFLESFVGGTFQDIQGRASGWVHVGGTFHDIDITAAVKAEASAKVRSLHTTYRIQSDSIYLKTNRMEFNHVNLSDRDGHQGLLQGTILHNYLRNMSYNLNLQSDNMLLFDTHGFEEDSFYATAYAGGTVTIAGQGNELDITADVESKPGTIIAYNASTPEDITNTSFITFVDKTPRNAGIPSAQNQQSQVPAEQVAAAEEEEETTNIHINMNVNCTQDATIRVLMDNMTGDDITCHGTGNIKAEYFNKGSFKMYGIFNIVRGVYKMSLQQVIRKDFNLKSGTVTFNGKPFDGQLDVQAVYTVNSASLRDLSPSATFSQKSTTKVNCLMNLTGNLLKPSIAFDLELPNVTDEDQAMVKSLVATDDQKNRQIIYLLGIGRFYTDEYNQDANQTNQAMNSLLTSTISGQFNQILSQVANTSNWNFGANLNPGQNGLNNMEFQTMLSGSLFNNRLLINGNFGYRENAMANTNFVGDFDLQWLLNQAGTISLKAYNETNDRYFTKNTLTTQGVGIQFKRDFFHWKDLLFWKKKSTPARTEVDSISVKPSDKPNE